MAKTRKVPIEEVHFTPNEDVEGGLIAFKPLTPIAAHLAPVAQRLDDGLEFPLEQDPNGFWTAQIPGWSGYCMAY